MTEQRQKRAGIGRRDLLTGAGLAVAAAAMPRATRAAALESESWDYETDVVCVGSGAAACGAAVTAVSQGAKVVVVEKMPLLGGTTAKSGGVTWIANNPILRAHGVEDRRDDCLRYLARYAYPQSYTPASPTLGLPDLQYRLLEAFYDNGSRMVEHMQKIGAVKFKEFRLFQVDRPAPDYADHLPENKVPAGRALEPAVGSGSSAGGSSLAVHLEEWLRAHDVPLLTEHRVTRVLKDGGRAIGVEAMNGNKRVRIRARRGVVFGTGGYAHNPELIGLHQTALYGSCAAPGATGDFIPIAAEAGARMGSLHTAWRTQVVLDEALENRVLGLAAFVLPGDSMIVVNKYGARVVNEKRDYNDRTMTHFVFDPTRAEYPNHLQYMIFDERSLDAFGGAFPIPLDKRESRHLIEGATLDQLAANIGERLATIAPRTGGEKLAPEFTQAMKASVERFGEYAEKGRDPEFDRGRHAYDREWHLLFSARREGTKYPVNALPNITMHPIAKTGPYYAFILAAGALDTNGGPLINEKAQVLAHDGEPIPGLYGAGNCIASPARAAYFGAGATIGLALTFGYIAGMNAAGKQAQV
jgi:3-oxosteroid 1-dehydrogenase